jgi:adenylate cyclase
MDKAKRRLQAILCADAVGYSRLMGADDEHALSALNASRHIFREAVKNYDGRVIDTAGDSVLAVFDSVIEAVDAALEIQAQLAERNAAEPIARQMPFRIGVNLGDVIEQGDGTIYGDGVNVAARIQSLADPGGITLSGAVYEFVQGRTTLAIHYLGEHEAKNITRPIRVYAITTAPQNGGATTAAVPSDQSQCYRSRILAAIRATSFLLMALARTSLLSCRVFANCQSPPGIRRLPIRGAR